MSQPPINLTYAMVGGGIGAFIGEVHRRAINLTGRAKLVAGALSSTPEKSLESAKALGLDEDRSYSSYQELIEREENRDDRVDFIVVVTPNDTHYPIAKLALENGFHVVVDKPATHTSAQAKELEQLAASKGLLCCVTYNYTGYPMIRQARAMIQNGELGTIRKVFAEYHQGWLASHLESTGHKQASWRVDPAKAGLGGALGDIGTHAENLVSFVTGLKIETLFADLKAFVDGRALDDDASMMINFAGGASGLLTASQVCVGEHNGITLRIHGDQGGIAWQQEHPNELRYTKLGQHTVTLSRGAADLHPESVVSSMSPPGHTEGYLEAFSNIYRGVIDAVCAMKHNTPESPLAKLIPTMTDGTQGIRFVERCVESSKQNAPVRW